MVIRPFTPTDTQAWSNLLAVSFNRQASDMDQLLQFLQATAPLLAYGAWDGPYLAAQYSCLLRQICIPNTSDSVLVGLSLNMAVHPDYRGRGLVKQVAAPVYEAVQAAGGIAGVGFSNAEGVQVDKRSKGYGYRVVGKLQPMLAWMLRRPPFEPLLLTAVFPTHLPLASPATTSTHFYNTPNWLEKRFAYHPFRRYQFAVGNGQLVVYRPFGWQGLRGVSLLAVYGDDVASIVGRWLSAMWHSGVRFVHVLTSPRASVRAALRQTAVTLPMRYSRTPYYLTAKSLSDNTPDTLFNFTQWDCIGGDIL